MSYQVLRTLYVQKYCVKILPLVVYSSNISISIAKNLYPPPNDVHLADVRPGQVTFTWTSVSSSCSSVYYNITSDCGVCPTTINMTTATCSDLQLSTEPVVCTFRVSSVVCDLTGNPSEPVVVTIKGMCRALNEYKWGNIVCLSHASQLINWQLLQLQLSYSPMTYLVKLNLKSRSNLIILYGNIFS